MNLAFQKLLLVAGCCAIFGSATQLAAEDGARTERRFSTAGFFAVEGSPRTVANFNPGWRFRKGDAPGAESVGFDDSAWEAANLPHGLEILGENASGGRNYQGPAWYRKKFAVEPPGPGARTYLYFEAVMGEAQVWVNGRKVAEHFGGYLPFAADISDLARTDGSLNVVAVRAVNSDSVLYPPGKKQSGLDFTYMGGIYRDVFLIRTGPVHVTLTELSESVAGGGVFAATLDVDGNEAKMEVRVEVANTDRSPRRLTVRNTLEDAAFRELRSVEEQIDLKAGETRRLAQKLDAEKVRLWHTEDPYLHYIRTDVVADGKVVDSLRTRLGVRLIEMRGADGLYLNKKWIGKKLIGANRHQDYVYVGNAAPNSAQWRDAKLLREGGCHIVRAGHYPMDPAFYDACDELGLFATTANPGWHFYNFKEPIFEQRLYEDTRNLVRRDRNRPCILMWETALNETPRQPDHAMHNMHLAAHDEFPFPGMYTVTDHQEAKKGGLDIYYHGDDPHVNSFNREYGDGGEVDNWTSQNATTRVKMEWGETPLLTQSLIQAATLNQRFGTPKVRIGGSLWCGIDHQRGYHPDPFHGGLLDAFRRPRYTYYLYQSQNGPDYRVQGIRTGPMLFNTHELTQISPSDVVIYSNCDEVRLTWLGEVIGTQKPSSDPKYKNLPHPPFIFEGVFDFAVIKSDWRRKTKDIEMIAEGIIGGKVVIRDVKNYPEQSAKLKLSVSDEGLGLVADGSDFIPVRATVVDPDGYKKVLASEQIFFEVEGPGQVIGDSTTFANPAKTSMGVATALIRSTLKAGEIRITAHSNGLQSDSVTVRSTTPRMTLSYDSRYVESSRNPTSAAVVVTQKRSGMTEDTMELQKELEAARLEITGLEQEVQELRQRLARPE